MKIKTKFDESYLLLDYFAFWEHINVLLNNFFFGFLSCRLLNISDIS